MRSEGEDGSDSDTFTYRDLDREFAPCCGCGEMRAVWRFACPKPCLHTDMLCTPCARSWICPSCKKSTSWQEMRLDSPPSQQGSPASSRSASKQTSMASSESNKSLLVHIDTPRHVDTDTCDKQSDLAKSFVHVSNASDKLTEDSKYYTILPQTTSTENITATTEHNRDAYEETPESKQLVECCCADNSIVELKGRGISKCHLALQVADRCIMAAEYTDKANALILAPTVPIVKQYHECASSITYKEKLRACQILGSAEVDAWTRDEWHENVVNNKNCNVLLTTPQLFLNALDSKYIELEYFSVLVIDSCQHCSGKHPFATILTKYAHKVNIRVIGLSENLVKRKIKGDDEKQQHLKALEKITRAKVRP